MVGFELSERWCGWTDLDVIFGAARAAIEAGSFDPPICEIVFDEEFDPLTGDTFEEARAHRAAVASTQWRSSCRTSTRTRRA